MNLSGGQKPAALETNMFQYSNPSPARILSRPKLGGGGRHFGVELWDGSIIHLTLTGVEHVSRAAFLLNHEPKVEHVMPEALVMFMMERVRQSLESPHAYRFLVWNCEHFANWVVGRPAESAQVSGAIGVALLIALVGALSP